MLNSWLKNSTKIRTQTSETERQKRKLIKLSMLKSYVEHSIVGAFCGQQSYAS